MTVAAAVAPLLGCNTPSRRFRERVTLTVETPQGLVSGSSVTEQLTEFQDGWLGGMSGHMLSIGVRGEATMVDLGGRGMLFALLTKDSYRRSSSSPGSYEFLVFPELWEKAKEQSNGGSEAAIAYFIDTLNRTKPKGEIPLTDLGLLVRFRDLNDPRTVVRVDPNDLAASFGAGVKLAHATLEITDDPLTTGIAKILPWLDNLISLGASLDGDTSNVLPVPSSLARGLYPSYLKARTSP